MGRDVVCHIDMLHKLGCLVSTQRPKVRQRLPSIVWHETVGGLMWLILLCHNSIFVSTLRPLAYMADFTSSKLRINIQPLAYMADFTSTWPTHASLFGTLLHGGRFGCNIHIWSSFVGSNRNGSSPIFRNFLNGFHLVPEIGSCFHKTNLVCLILARIGLLLGHVLFSPLNACRACGLPRRCSLFKHGFLRPTTWVENRRKREDSPLLIWESSSCQTVVEGCQCIFAPSHHLARWHLSNRGSLKAPWSSKCSLWWRCLFAQCCSTLGGVEAFVRFCYP